jgi:hypothetical protein
MLAIVISGQDSSSISVISKKLELKSIIISRISPYISFTCTNFQKIYCSHFYVSVTQDEFRLVNEGGTLPIGLIVFERLRPDQVQTSECHDKPAETQAMLDPLLLLYR